MALALTVRDETTLGETTGELTLVFLTERVTLREIIRGRISQEVAEYNAARAGRFTGLVQPEQTERVVGGYRVRERRRLDWEAQYERALRAFAANGFLVLVGDRQATDLDEEIELRHDTTVTFLKLVPLVGG